MAALERQLEGTRSSVAREMSNLEAQLKQCTDALDSERSQAGFLRQQLQSTSASLDHEKQRAAQAQQQLQQVCDPCAPPSIV